MPGGVTTGQYETHYEFRGSSPKAIGQNATVTWTTQIALPKGTWLVEIFTYFALRNANMLVQLIADGQRYGNGSGLHNANGSPSLSVVSLPSILSDVVVTSASPQEIKVFLRGGPGGGEYASQGLAVLAWKLKAKRARPTLRANAAAKTRAKLAKGRKPVA